jgi:cysteine-S-conjugate beta-lyase
VALASAWAVFACPQSSSPAAKVEAPPGRGIGTRILHPENHPVHDPYGAVSPPLYQTATFGQPGATEGGPYDYTRSGNPTRTQLESQMAELEVCS